MDRPTTRQQQIWQSLHDPEYRYAFVADGINVGLAFQIRALRIKHALSQKDLSVLMGVSSNVIANWENPDYGKYTLESLRRLAKTFDVALEVRFIPFSEAARAAANLTEEGITPLSFEEEEEVANESNQ